MGKEAERRWGSFAVTYGRERTKNRLSEFVGLRISNEEEHEGGVEAVFCFERQADFRGAHILLARDYFGGSIGFAASAVLLPRIAFCCWVLA